MISVTEAKAIISKKIQPLPMVLMPIDDSVGYELANDIIAPINVPSFVQSSMDGYAFAFNAINAQQLLQIKDIVKAGAPQQISINENEAVRIFTGAPLPKGADTVLMQEKAVVENGHLNLNNLTIELGTNARPIGADVKKGAIALQKGSLLTPAAIGYLASLGITTLPVIKKPRVQIILTGDELQTIGKALNFGQIYESNSHTLLAALKQMGINQVEVVTVPDTLTAISTALKLALENADLILFTGGVSVGDYDFVIEATKANQVEQLFHKIKQKPGKPLFMGVKGEKVVCGLPGNPASVLSCFYNYVTVVLAQLSGKNYNVTRVKAILKNSYQKPLGLTHFLKGRFEICASNEHGDSIYEVTILEGQESFKMNSFALANCFVELAEALTEVNQGDAVFINLFPG